MMHQSLRRRQASPLNALPDVDAVGDVAARGSVLQRHSRHSPQLPLALRNAPDSQVTVVTLNPLLVYCSRCRFCLSSAERAMNEDRARHWAIRTGDSGLLRFIASLIPARRIHDASMR